ncbi:MAG: hypothetical protein M1816_004499 [Peltula sp. TS41687]|nr:MAG: hypothetical protein M1816_004499 [Peltula sp. TS41687]
MRFLSQSLLLAYVLSGLEAVQGRALPSNTITLLEDGCSGRNNCPEVKGWSPDTGATVDQDDDDHFSPVISKLKSRAPPPRPISPKPKPVPKPGDKPGNGTPGNPKPIGSLGSDDPDAALWSTKLQTGKEVDTALRSRADAQSDREGFPSLKDSKDYEIARSYEGKPDASGDTLGDVFSGLGINGNTNFRRTEIRNPGARQDILRASFSRKEGTIVAEWKYSKDYDATPNTGNRRLPQSELMYQQWKDLPGNGQLKFVIQKEVANEESQKVIARAYTTTGKNSRQPTTYAPNGADQKETDAFYALLGTDNSRPTAYMMTDHNKALGGARVTKIHIYPADDELLSPNMVLEIGH